MSNKSAHINKQKSFEIDSCSHDEVLLNSTKSDNTVPFKLRKLDGLTIMLSKEAAHKHSDRNAAVACVTYEQIKDSSKNRLLSAKEYLVQFYQLTLHNTAFLNWKRV